MPEARQRWRIGFARGEQARGVSMREALDAWLEGLTRAGFVPATSGERRPRPRLAFAASLPAVADTEHDLAELFLAERVTAAVARDRLGSALPPGFTLVALDDEWVGAPSLASRLAAAEYGVTVADPNGHGHEAVRTRVREILAAHALPFGRGSRGDEAGGVDLRPFLLDLRVESWDPGLGRGLLGMLLRHDQELGAGRPGEVIEAIGLGLRVLAVVRRRLCLREELAERGGPGHGGDAPGGLAAVR